VALPVITYGDKMSLHFNGEDIEIGAAAGAYRWRPHPFSEADVIHGRRVPHDGHPGRRRQRGTVKGTVAASSAVIDLAPNTMIIPGTKCPVVRMSSFRDNTIEAQKRRRADQEGMTFEQVIARTRWPTSRRSSSPPRPRRTSDDDRFYTQFYTALKSEM
jgi:hypothetical protein